MATTRHWKTAYDALERRFDGTLDQLVAAEANRDAARNAVAMVAAELHQATLDRDQARACVAGLVAALEGALAVGQVVGGSKQAAKAALAAVPEGLRRT